MRAIVLGLAVMAMAFSLPKPWMMWTQAIAGAVLFCLGVWDVWASRKEHAPKTDPISREVIQKCIDTKKPVVAKRSEDGKVTYE